MSRPAFKVTDETRARVKGLATLAMSEDHIARIIGCSPETLRQRFARELALGRAEGNAAAAGALFAKARSGDLSAIIFWLKTHHWVTAARQRNQRAAIVEPEAPFSGVVIVPTGHSQDEVGPLLPYMAEAVRRYRKRREQQGVQKKRPGNRNVPDA
jgi:hypothetical protein